MGDEVRHTQGGNNNAYCQDNDISWFDWTRIGKHADVHRFAKLLIQRRLLRDIENERQRVSLTTLLQQAEKAWHGAKLNQPDWSDGSHSMVLGGTLRGENLRFHLILNAYWEPVAFELPKLEGGASWGRWIDTGLDCPSDIVPWREAPAVVCDVYPAEARSVVLLFVAGPGGRT
jgi:isoamylase